MYEHCLRALYISGNLYCTCREPLTQLWLSDSGAGRLGADCVWAPAVWALAPEALAAIIPASI